MARLTAFLGLVLILSWGAICSSALTTFSLKNKLQELESRLEAKIEAKNARLEEKVAQLEAQLELNNELRQDLALKVIQLEAKVEQQDSLLTSLLREKNERTATDFNSVSINNNQSAVFINGLPSSCEDLKLIGHTLNGFYSVMGSAKMESVYCDFTKLPDDPDFEKWIGFADVKSAPVHFYVTRNSDFVTQNTPIPFDLARVNEGNAMDLASGIFTAPRPGIYFFSFAATARLDSSTVDFYSHLYLNGKIIGSSRVLENNGPVYQFSPFSLQLTLNLKKDDQLWVTINYYGDGSLSLDDYSADHYTHFTGFMLEEEIAASL